MPRLELFPFCYRCPRTGKWRPARYRAERHGIAERFAVWEITNLNPNARSFTPHRAPIGQLGPVIAVTSSSRRVQVVGAAR